MNEVVSVTTKNDISDAPRGYKYIFPIDRRSADDLLPRTTLRELDEAKIAMARVAGVDLADVQVTIAMKLLVDI